MPNLKKLMTVEQWEVWERFDTFILSKKAPLTKQDYEYHMKTIVSLMPKKSFDLMIKEDFEDLFIKISKKRNIKSIRTINSIRRFIKRFFRWLYKEELKESLPDFFKDEIFKEENTGDSAVSEEDHITEEEIFRVIDAGENFMEQCFIAMIYDLWARINEVRKVKIKDIKEHKKKGFTYVLKTIIKLGRKGRKEEFEKRSIVLVKSLSYLRNWLNIHPFKDDPNSHLFLIKYNGEWGQISRSTGWRIIKKAAKKAGIEKRVFPHLLRHCAIKIGRDRGVSDKITRHKAGWSIDSNQLRIYDKFSESSIMDQAAQVGVISREEKEKDQEKKIQCPRCHTLNYYSDYCKICSTNLKEPYNPLQESEDIKKLQEALKKKDEEIAQLNVKLDEVIRFIQSVEGKFPTSGG